MKASFSLNNSEIAYLIHGQYFRFDYDVANCFALIFIYDNGEKVEKLYYPQKKNGIFNAIFFKIISSFTNLINPIYWLLKLKKFYKKIYFKRSKGVFENATNSYNPNLKIIAFGLGVKVFRYRLKINFINSKPPKVEVNPINCPEVVQINTKLKLPQFRLPQFQQNQLIGLQIKNKSMIINQHNDLDTLI